LDTARQETKEKQTFDAGQDDHTSSAMSLYDFSDTSNAPTPLADEKPLESLAVNVDLAAFSFDEVSGAASWPPISL
jgi:hypothetical protein